ncbi:MAG: putative quinol monooxygenase [Microvirga sp.]
MHAVVWRYRAAPGREAEFESLYGAEGGWARLFRGSRDYLGTDLYRDTAQAGVYLTIDRWTSATAYDDFLQRARDAYAALDARGDALTVEEIRLGTLDA